jgi:hypothetical protein
VNKVLPFNLFTKSNSLLEKKIGPFYNDELNPTFWTEKKSKDDDSEWIFDQRVRKKLLRIADDFFEKFGDILKKRSLIDVQLTGSIANYNYSPLSDLDVHLVVNLEGINDENPKILKSSIDGIRFMWNLRHDISIRGYDVELYLQDKEESYTSTGIFSLTNNKWVKKPVYDPPTVDESSVEKKFQSIAYDIEQLESRLLLLSSLPNNSKQLYKRAERLKEKIMKMRKEGLADKGEFSIGNLTFKKLRNEGYIEKLINVISQSYDKIYTE